MKYLIYMSAATEAMTEAGLLNILTVSRKNNSVNNVTGMLLYGEETFVQVLEGEDTLVDQTYENIKKDPRHINVTIITKGETNERQFADWAMGFKTLDSKMLAEIRGFKDVSFTRFLNADNLHPAYTVLKTFAQASKLI